MLIAASLGYSVRGRLAVVRFTRQCSLLHCGCLHTQPAHSMHVKPRTGMASMRVLRSVAVEWSLLCMSNKVIIELTNNRPRAPVYLYRNELSYSKNGDGLISTRPSVCKVPLVLELSQGQC
jgi:hypothetical protein